MSDLIDRKDLGAAIDNWLAIDRYYHPYSKQKTIPVSELVDIIKLLPSAQRTGRWIGREFGYCSCCGHEGCASDIWSGCETMFCPNCGARMEETDERT